MKYIKDLQFLLVYNYLLAFLKIEEFKFEHRYKKINEGNLRRNVHLFFKCYSRVVRMGIQD